MTDQEGGAGRPIPEKDVARGGEGDPASVWADPCLKGPVGVDVGELRPVNEDGRSRETVEEEEVVGRIVLRRAGSEVPGIAGEDDPAAVGADRGVGRCSCGGPVG